VNRALAYKVWSFLRYKISCARALSLLCLWGQQPLADSCNCVGASSCEAIDVDICSWLELHGV
jgi:hypothetical protein